MHFHLKKFPEQPVNQSKRKWTNNFTNPCIQPSLATFTLSSKYKHCTLTWRVQARWLNQISVAKQSCPCKFLDMRPPNKFQYRGSQWQNHLCSSLALKTLLDHHKSVATAQHYILHIGTECHDRNTVLQVLLKGFPQKNNWLLVQGWTTKPMRLWMHGYV